MSVRPWRSGGKIALVIAVLLIALNYPAEGRTRRYRKRHPFVVALQPFQLARAGVHAVARPIVYRAPRIARTLAVTPLRAAYRMARPAMINSVQAEPLEAEDEASISEPLAAEPIQVAYYTSPARPASAPRVTRPELSETVEDDDGPRRLEADDEDDNARLMGGSHPTVSGNRARLRNGIAYAPSNAPAGVKRAIWATNSLRRKPYIWGGGHGSFNDRGYDCSGTVSFALHHAGLLSAPLPSSELMRFGERGRGRWITIYSRPGHTFATIAGLRLDTTDFFRGGNVGPRWHDDGRDTGGYVARHPAGM